jgi:hypothetical protein
MTSLVFPALSRIRGFLPIRLALVPAAVLAGVLLVRPAARPEYVAAQQSPPAPPATGEWFFQATREQAQMVVEGVQPVAPVGSTQIWTLTMPALSDVNIDSDNNRANVTSDSPLCRRALNPPTVGVLCTNTTDLPVTIQLRVTFGQTPGIVQLGALSNVRGGGGAFTSFPALATPNATPTPTPPSRPVSTPVSAPTAPPLSLPPLPLPSWPPHRP